MVENELKFGVQNYKYWKVNQGPNKKPNEI